MSATLVSSNTTIKVNGNVSGTAATLVASLSAALYTAPANGYAIVQVAATAGTITSWEIGGRIATLTATPNFPIHVGPGATVKFNSSTAATGVVSGIEFINTP
jgi:hypothetical protein